MTGRPGTHAAAAMYYEADNSQTAEFKSRAGSAATDDQLTRIENRLMDEMVNTKMVSQSKISDHIKMELELFSLVLSTPSGRHSLMFFLVDTYRNGLYSVEFTL